MKRICVPKDGEKGSLAGFIHLPFYPPIGPSINLPTHLMPEIELNIWGEGGWCPAIFWDQREQNCYLCCSVLGGEVVTEAEKWSGERTPRPVAPENLSPDPGSMEEQDLLRD